MVFLKEFKKKAGYSRHKEQRVQRRRSIRKHDAFKGIARHCTEKGVEGGFSSGSQGSWGERQGLLGQTEESK